ncbi:hypothetical protein ACHAXT_009637 [Thalassiosira profunda]
MAAHKSSWVDVPPGSDFSIDNIPFGVCSFPQQENKGNASNNACHPSIAPSTPRCCTAIGACAVDLHLLSEAGLLDDMGVDFHPRVAFARPSLNDFMACEKNVWVAVRNRLISLFLDADSGDISADPRLRDNVPLRSQAFRPLSEALFHLPAAIGDYTDFYSSREHATNVGIMFRGKDNALQPNWLHMPIGYHGRGSSVYPSTYCGATRDGDSGEGRMGTVRRPCGQLQKDAADPSQGSVYGPCQLMDFELEVAFFVGGPTNSDSNENGGRPLTLAEAKDRIFGYVLMNDWSARDIQKWEYVPLGPFTSKNFATTISTWIVTPMALEPYRCNTSAGVQGGASFGGGTELSEGIDVGGGGAEGTDPTPLEYLRDPDYGSYDVSLSVSLQPEATVQTTQICQSNLRNMYWSSVQQLVHHSVTGCPMRPGDLLASGTISGKEHNSFGSMLELSWKGTREIPLKGGGTRRFLQDGDAVIMEGWCEKEGTGRVGFGQCAARVLPAVPFPYDSGRDGATEPPPHQRYSQFKLYGFWRSTCTWRVRIALAAKDIDCEVVPVDLFNNAQTDEEYASKNPMRQVPVLEFADAESGRTVQITQSLAIIEFLESAFPDQGGQLLPHDPVARAKAKEVAEIVNAGIQPLQNFAVVDAIENIRAGKGNEFRRQAMEKGLSSLETLLTACHAQTGERSAGMFAIGSHGPTLADVCLVPQLYNARMFGVDCGLYPTLSKIEDACKDHPWFVGAEPERQPDYR